MVRLEWVVVGKDITHISKLRGGDSDARRRARCPCCNEPVVLRFGDVRAHHAAHRAGATCSATAGETALHLNTKHHIALQLTGAGALLVTQRCLHAAQPPTSSCAGWRSFVWAADWDQVDVEAGVSTRRPDIVLRRAGLTAAALEVRVTHAVDSEKAEVLARAGVPWVEVLGCESIYEGEGRWHAILPLPVIRIDSTEGWVCPQCQKWIEDEARLVEAAAAAERQAAAARRVAAQRAEAERQVNLTAARASYDAELADGWLPHRAKFVDLYYPSGKKFREVFLIGSDVRGGRRQNFALRKRSDGRELYRGPPTDRVGSQRAITNALWRYCADIGERDAKVDEHPTWHKLDPIARASDAVLEAWVLPPVTREEAAVLRQSGLLGRLADRLINVIWHACPWRYQWHRWDEYWFLPRDERNCVFHFATTPDEEYEFSYVGSDGRVMSAGFGLLTNSL